MNCPGNINIVKTVNQAVKKEIFGIQVDDIDCASLSEKINTAIYTGKKIIINYLNAYSVTQLWKKKIFKEAIQNADIVHADGIGIWLAARMLKNSRLTGRFNFTDCSFQFLEYCQKKNLSIFLLGSNNDILKKAVLKIREKYPVIRISGTLNGYDEAGKNNIVEYINGKSPDILWVGMGTPKQELWIAEYKNKLHCSVIQSVGDIFTFLACEKTRGPVIFQKLGLEWLARVVRHPRKYFNRYLVGIPVFIFILIKELLQKQNKT